MNEREFRRKVMEEMSGGLPQVRAVAVVFRCEGRYLLEFNEKWGGLTFPATTLREFVHEHVFPEPVLEDPQVAAARAAFVHTETSFTREEIGEPAFSLRILEQSQRDGQWKAYHTDVYVLDWHPAAEPMGDRPTEWMTKEEIAEHLPVSPTARAIAEKL